MKLIGGGYRLLCALFLGLTLIGGSAFADDGPPLPPLEDEGGGTRSWDWVQLKSGEWLKGKITRMYDEKLFFDSDEFDDVSVDWGDVASLIPAGPVICRFEGRRTVTGELLMRAGHVRIKTGSRVIEARREEVLSMLPGTGTGADFWSGRASLSLSTRSGNTRQTDLTIRGETMRQTSLTRFKASYTGEFSSVSNDATANSHRVPASFDVFLTGRFFVTVPTAQFFTDRFQNIQSRLSAGVGAGYEIIDIPTVLWDVSAGVGYQNTIYESVAVGADSSENDTTVGVGTKVEFDLPRGIEWDNSYKVQLVVSDIGKTNHHAESILSFDIWGPLEFDLSFLFDRVEDPVPDAEGVSPESNDYRLTAGLALDF